MPRVGISHVITNTALLLDLSEPRKAVSCVQLQLGEGAALLATTELRTT